MRPDWKKYLLTLLITGAIFVTALLVSNGLNNRRIAELQSTEDNISTDILSLETQFDLLQQLSCTDVSSNSVLSSELNSLAGRLDYAESSLGANNDAVIHLKRQYSLLEIKDYLLMQKIAEKCAFTPVFVLYFYSNEGDCDDCKKEGDVLTFLRQEYPQLRVYSFDYNLDLSALRTLRTVTKLSGELPAISINGKVYYGFKSVDDIVNSLPELKKLAEKTASSTKESK